MSELEDRLATVVRDACREAVADALGDVEARPDPAEPEEGWRSRLWAVEDDTRLTLADTAEALGCSERTVRRYANGETDHPLLPSRRGPAGLTFRAADVRRWLQDVEEAARFRQAAGGGR